MLSTIHFGLLAACLVFIVPMVMAGWHLSRNKMLFFSCALFITLAVGVHLTPYFPNISTFLTQPEVILSDPVSFSRHSCVFLLHNVLYNHNNNNNVRVCVNRSSNSNGDIDTDCDMNNKSWDWIETGRVTECGFTKLGKEDVSVLLNGSWVVFAGDSQVRLMVVSLLELVMGLDGLERVRGELFKRHSDYTVVVDEIGMKLDFVWAPYVENLTGLVGDLKRNVSLPDVLVMGAGLWDMLHVNNASEYGVSLGKLKDSTLALLPVSSDVDTDGVREFMSTRLLHLFWVGMPTLMTSMLNTEEKREKMTSEVSNLYENEISESKLLRQSGGPLLKLDVRLLSSLCGPQCTSDGMHYDGIVYDAAVQILLNALLIESNQMPR